MPLRFDDVEGGYGTKLGGAQHGQDHPFCLIPVDYCLLSYCLVGFYWVITG